MKLAIEADRIVDLGLLDIIEFRHQKRVATGYVGTVPVVTESEILYRYYQGEGKKEIISLPSVAE